MEEHITYYFLGLSHRFWIVILVMLLFMTAILTAAYNDDKTKGL
jgi:hypothetical protein